MCEWPLGRHVREAASYLRKCELPSNQLRRQRDVQIRVVDEQCLEKLVIAACRTCAQQHVSEAQPRPRPCTRMALTPSTSRDGRRPRRPRRIGRCGGARGQTPPLKCTWWHRAIACRHVARSRMRARAAGTLGASCKECAIHVAMRGPSALEALSIWFGGGGSGIRDKEEGQRSRLLRGRVEDRCDGGLRVPAHW